VIQAATSTIEGEEEAMMDDTEVGCRSYLLVHMLCNAVSLIVCLPTITLYTSRSTTMVRVLVLRAGSNETEEADFDAMDLDSMQQVEVTDEAEARQQLSLHWISWGEGPGDYPTDSPINDLVRRLSLQGERPPSRIALAYLVARTLSSVEAYEDIDATGACFVF
jgi:hypothetical protein